MESESGTNNTKISDSGYSNSCSNTTSQGSASSKSRHSGASDSSNSSGYGGEIKPNESSDSSHPQSSKRNKDREHKKKKQKPSTTAAVPQVFTVPTDAPASPTIKPICDVETIQSPAILELPVPDILDVEIQNSERLLTIAAPLVQTDAETVLTEAETNLPLWPEQEPVGKDVENEFDGEPSKPDVMSSSQPEVNDGFCCVISMQDGVVLYTTPSLTAVLGFPKDTWLGQSFIDFVHPKDRETFANQVSTSVALPLVDSQGKFKDVRSYVYVCLRRYTNVKSAEVNKPVSYQAFHLTVTIKQMSGSSETSLYEHNNGLFLVIIAVPVYSAYKAPGERKKSNKFGMRHTATCIFSYVDPEVVTNFGFLPQDMLGKSVFDFYHPEDMPFLKEVYKSVMKTCQINGSVFRSKPYRFLVQNGCFAMIETEWSSVINPWSRRLEFVISLHQVLQGPLNPNVFDVASNEEYKHIPEKIIKQGQILQAEIIQILAEELTRPVEVGKQEVSKRCNDLANFMESLMNTSKLAVDVNQEFNPSISERDSVMLGEISPHHDFRDSKSSSETPPSYNQLNYNENITRFFQSNPKTTVTSDESSNVMDTDGKNSQDCAAPNNQKWLSPIQNSGASGCGSAGNLSSGSNPNLESGTTSGTNTSNDDYKPPHLTESVLVRHNEDMEKIMLQRHKKERSHIKDRETKKSQHKLEKYANEVLRDDANEQHNHGLKRSGSHSWGKQNHKLSKHQRQEEYKKDNNKQKTLMAPNMPARGENTENWPSFSVTIAPNTQISTAPNPTYSPAMVPLCYMPTFVQPRPAMNGTESPQRYQVQYMPVNLVCSYTPIFLPQPVLYPTVPVFPLHGQNSSSPVGQESRNFRTNMVSPEVNPGTAGPMTSSQVGNNVKPSSNQPQFGKSSDSRPQCDRPSSQATSVKAEPGSRMGSIASASVVNKALSECSRKDLGLQSVCSPDTPLVSPPDGETQAEQFNMNSKANDSMKRPEQQETSYRTKRMDEESSCYSSSYSSLLKTDTGSGSNDESTSNNNTNRTDDEMLKKQRKVYPMRKKDPPWVESVSVSPDLIYRYQVAVRDPEVILKTDMDTLKSTEQPMMVNDQLHQLYIEMELEGLSKALTLEESFSWSSSSSSSDEGSTNVLNKSKKKQRSYSSLMMIYEEDAPMPPSNANY